MRLQPSLEDLQEEYDRGYDIGLTDGINTINGHISTAYQQGQVLMKKKSLSVLQKYYGPSVYERIKTLLDEIELEE